MRRGGSGPRVGGLRLGANPGLGGRTTPRVEQPVDLRVHPAGNLLLDPGHDGGARFVQPGEGAHLVLGRRVRHSIRSQTGKTRYSTPSRFSVRPAERNEGSRASAVSKPAIRL